MNNIQKEDWLKYPGDYKSESHFTTKENREYYEKFYFTKEFLNDYPIYFYCYKFEEDDYFMISTIYVKNNKWMYNLSSIWGDVEENNFFPPITSDLIDQRSDKSVDLIDQRSDKSVDLIKSDCFECMKNYIEKMNTQLKN